MIARALIGYPPIIFLDEPTTGLDVLVARSVRKTIKKLARHATILLATHNMYEAEELCDRVAIIQKGKILEVASPLELKQKYSTGSESFEDVVARILDVDNMDIEELEKPY